MRVPTATNLQQVHLVELGIKELKRNQGHVVLDSFLISSFLIQIKINRHHPFHR
jgi:hypothetical protein